MADHPPVRQAEAPQPQALEVQPDPEPLLLGAERLGAHPAETAYVGDSPFDVRAAKAAGMFAVAVTWGRIHDRARLEAEQPDAIVDRAEELLGLL